MLIFLFILFSSADITDPPSNIITISFDEGPSRNLNKVLEILEENKVKAAFHLNPFRMHRDANDTEKILSNGHDLGLSIPIPLNGLEDSEIENIINIYVEEYKKVTKYHPKLVRLSRSGYGPNSLKICDKYNLIVTKPNLDSEDIEKEYIDLLLDEIELYSYNVPLSICFRDRIDYTVNYLDEILYVTNKIGREIVSLTEYHNFKIDQENENNIDKENGNENNGEKENGSENKELNVDKEDENKIDNESENNIDKEINEDQEVKIAMIPEKKNKRNNGNRLIWVD
ncbi:Polysaccharide deacetylase [Spraguea lophii 42_110]|uniref:Polysaccharide deacetylase n=1 Tax=Spraguea lophii (strain 42_110) TaxID=1358809 RepID=S7WDC3_SPRLO|nr:Polysaccharide deacetylase [Spraguea lophii 42_110]